MCSCIRIRDTGRRDLSRERDWWSQGEGVSSGVLGTLLPCGLQLERTLFRKELLFDPW